MKYLYIFEDGSMLQAENFSAEDYPAIEGGILTLVNMRSGEQCVSEGVWESIRRSEV